jgi:methionyl-tRNA synthetase
MGDHCYYITTAIDYVNAAPHLGHAYEKIATDVISRYKRLQQVPVFFLTGTDEHGSKVEKTAKGKGLDPKAYTDEIATAFKATWAELNLQYDRFIRTTDTDHYAVVAHLWKMLAEKEDIYKASYTGLYCSGCENFVTQRDLTETGECPNHLVKPEPVEEENYFFRLTKYKEAIKEHIHAHPEFIQPAFRKEEVLKLLEDVEDISVSRSIQSVTWGIPVPGDDSQRIYVWIDALSNYLTGCGYQHNEALFKKCWPADLHMIGKDILRFHAIYWPAMLMAANLPLPKVVYAHGFITLNDSKISKSTGNIVSPQSLVERFELQNTDPIRYYLLTCCSFGQDGNFTEDDFKTKINADLSNNLGNLLNRTLNMTLKYFEGVVPSPLKTSPMVSSDMLTQVAQHYEDLAFLQASEGVLSWVDQCNKLINESEPWTLHKNGETEKLAQILYDILNTLRQVAIALSPIIPTLSQNVWQQLGYQTPISSQSWQDILGSPLPKGQVLKLEGPILPRLDSEIVGAGKKK